MKTTTHEYLVTFKVCYGGDRSLDQITRDARVMLARAGVSRRATKSVRVRRADDIRVEDFTGWMNAHARMLRVKSAGYKTRLVDMGDYARLFVEKGKHADFSKLPKQN